MGDPSHNMDELLKAYARKRREEGGDPPPLHSAMRHQLQEEVRRAYAVPPPAPRPWFARFLLRPAMAGALALAMVTVGLFVALWPQVQAPPGAASTAPSERESLDRKSSGGSGASEIRAAAKPLAPPAATPMTMAAKESPAPAAPVLEGQVLRRDEPTAAAAYAVPHSMVAGGALSSRSASTSTPPLPPAPASIAGAKLAEEVAPSKAAADEVRDLAAPSRNKDLAKQELGRNFVLQDARFLNQAAPKARRNTGPALLQSFRVNRVGNEVVLVDADGSVYRGSVEVAASDMDKLADRNGKLKADAVRLGLEQKGGNASLSAQSFAFRVSGTNATLRQAVEITGTWFPGEAQEPAGRTGWGPASSNQAANALDYQDNRGRAQQLQNTSAPKGRIQGRARLADKNEVEVDAVTTPSP